MGETLKIFGKFDISIGKSNSEKGWALLWPKRDIERSTRQIIEKNSEQYKATSETIYQKYMNTLKFYDMFN